METEEQIAQFKEFFETYYHSKIADNATKGKKRVTIEYNDLSKFDKELALLLLEDPEEVLKAAEIAITQMDFEGIKVRIRGDIPDPYKIRLRDLRAKHLNQFLTVEGTIETKTDVGVRMSASRFECPSCANIINVIQLEAEFKEPTNCLKKGTKVLTPSGYKPIEKVKKVLCVDYEGNLIKEEAKVFNSGFLETYKINEEIECSEDHMWFVVRGGRYRFLPTKDLNSSDVLLMIDGNNLYYLRKEIYSRSQNENQNRQREMSHNLIRKKNLLRRMQKDTKLSLSEKKIQDRFRYKPNIRYVYQPKDINQRHSKDPLYRQESSINKVKRQKHNSSVISCTELNRHTKREEDLSNWKRQPTLQKWREMWRDILPKISKGKQSRRMPFLWQKRDPNSPPQRFKSPKPQSKQSNSYVQFMPYEISRITKTSKKVEMYDLKVLDYNNFIIKVNNKEILSHNCGCGRKGKFHLLSKERMDCFTLRIQELTKRMKYGSKLVIKSVLCKEDLTDTIIEERLVEGMKVIINGIYKEKMLIKSGKKQTELITYIEANYIKISDESFYDVELTEQDIKKIKEFSKQPDLIRKIAEGLFQGVHGYYKIKEALVLQAIGGVSDYETIPKLRGNVHILLVGDPGENKSAFLEFASNFNPKSILVVGKSVSAVGLSGAVIKDELSGSFVLKPGAIPLANNGIIFIDELDKMKPEDRDILHEPLEQQCYDSETEVLTKRGWLFFKDLKPKDEIVTLDKDKIQYQRPTNLFKYFYEGPMYTLNNRRVNLCVTPNHKIYTSIYKGANSWNPFKLIPIKDIFLKRQRFKKDAKWEGKHTENFILPEIMKYNNQNHKGNLLPTIKINMDIWLEFLGYYLSEGSTKKTMGNKGKIPYTVCITQKKGKTWNKINGCLKRLGFKYFFNSKNGSFCINNKQLASYLSQFGLCYEKYIPSYVKELSKKQISVFIEALMLGDGCSRKGESSYTRTYITTSKILADDVQELLLKIGISGQITSRDISKYKHQIRGRRIRSCRIIYEVGFIIFCNLSQINHNQRRDIKKTKYGGLVYCCDVPNHIIYVRRSGKPYWCGNSVSISKANLPDRKMLARESFLISMNPKNGYFNEFDMVYDQIDLPPTLVSRFDLVFVMRKNRIKSEEVKKFEKEKARTMMTRNEPKLQKKLIEFHRFMRKYIAYARQNVFPKFDKNLAEEYLPEKYAHFDFERKKGEIDGKMDFPITPRHLNIIKRLSEARRRVSLGDRVLVEDVDYAIEKIKGSLKDIAVDIETGKLDTEWVSDGVPAKKKKLIEIFDDVCDKIELANKDILLDDLFKELESRGFKSADIEAFLEKKRTYGDIFFPRHHIMKRM